MELATFPLHLYMCLQIYPYLSLQIIFIPYINEEKLKFLSIKYAPCFSTILPRIKAKKKKNPV